ncbi:hypothetical protein MMC17_007666 [Xylographa soralifera]|nr:hypothetical protein [Xylographa soralifera]
MAFETCQNNGSSGTIFHEAISVQSSRLVGNEIRGNNDAPPFIDGKGREAQKVATSTRSVFIIGAMVSNHAKNEDRKREVQPETLINGAEKFVQEPVAVVGFACRLPGQIASPRALWEFLGKGGIASNSVPESRFNLKGHYDGSKKPGTMRPPGGNFLEGIELEVFDASFFEISRAKAISMDPNQRQLLEVIYEGLENAGTPLKTIDGAPVGCFIGSYASGKIGEIV